jgi:hypothetical protein
MTDNEKRPRLVLPMGATVKDAAKGFEEKVSSLAFLLLNEDDEVAVPKDTELDIPEKGKVKASSGTSMKATSGTRIPVASVELVLPACTLSKPMQGVNVELSAGTTAKTDVAGSAPFVVIDSIEIKGQS